MTTKEANGTGSGPGGEARGEQKRRPYRTQVAGVLAATFTLSLAYSVTVTFTGSHEGYSMVDPTLWVFYAVGFGLAALALTDRIWAWWVIAAVVLALIAVGIFYYPTVFPPSAQTTFAWFENDVYIGLLILAEYLCVQRLRSVSLTPEGLVERWRDDQKVTRSHEP